MNYIKIYTVVITFVMCMISASCASKSQENEKNELIKEMILYYGYYPDNSDAQIEEILEKLALCDNEAAFKWRKIMDYWKYTKNGLVINYGGLPSGLDNTDKLCIVVLGFQLDPDGSIKDELAGRLQTALSCAESYPDAYILCTGGGTAFQAPEASEAEKMAEWLMEKGIDADRIIIEDSSRTTGENAVFSYELLKKDLPSVEQVAIVSSDYHIPWGTMLFEAEFILNNDNDGGRKLSVVSNAAYKSAENKNYPFLYQAAGLLELAGLKEDAEDIYRGKTEKPDLK